MNEANIKLIEKDLIMRERTDDSRDTSYCRHCGHNHYENIGVWDCAKCGKNKAK